jgi:hypothetical protein
MRIQSSKDVTVSANRTMRKIVCQCVRGLHLRDNNTFVLFAPSRTRGPPLPNLYDLKSFLDSACALAAGVVDAHELLLETNELPSSSQHSKSRPDTKWNHRGLRRRMQNELKPKLRQSTASTTCMGRTFARVCELCCPGSLGCLPAQRPCSASVPYQHGPLLVLVHRQLLLQVCRR